VSAISLDDDRELQRILWACYGYWEAEGLPPEERIVCYSWVVRRYTEKFGGTFHPSTLARLASLGFLEREGGSRGGNRRYYRVVDPARLAEALHEWFLD